MTTTSLSATPSVDFAHSTTLWGDTSRMVSATATRGDSRTRSSPATR